MKDPLTFAGWLSLALFVLSLAALLGFARKHRRKQLLFGVQILQAGKVLLLHLQRHRGLIVALHSGVHEVARDLPSVREQVVRDMHRIATLDDWFADNENWQGITSHWAALSARCHHMSSEASFDQHSRLIASLLSLLNDAAEHYGVESNPRYASVQFAWKDLLQIAEVFGQCRALGMQIIISGQQGRYLDKNRERVLRHLGFITNTLNSPGCSRVLKGRNRNELDRYISFVHEQTLLSGDSNTAANFFKLVSEAIELVYDQFDSELLRLHRRVVV